jgi:hypothetical protein
LKKVQGMEEAEQSKKGNSGTHKKNPSLDRWCLFY